MKTKVIISIIYLILIPFFSYSQLSKTKYIEDERAFWIENIQMVARAVNVNECDPKSLDTVRYVVLNNWVSKQLKYYKDYNNYSFDFYYLHDQAFKGTIDFIKSIPIDSESYFKNIRFILDAISVQKNALEKEYAFDQMFQRFDNSGNSFVAYDLNKIKAVKNSIAKHSTNTNELIEKIKLSVKFAEYKATYDRVASFYIYANAIRIYDSLKLQALKAEALYKVGELYSTVNTPEFLYKAQAYFKDAAKEYFKLNDSANIAKSFFERAKVQSTRIGISNVLPNSIELLEANRDYEGIPSNAIDNKNKIIHDKRLNYEYETLVSIRNYYYLASKAYQKQLSAKELCRLWGVLGQYFEMCTDSNSYSYALQCYDEICIYASDDVKNIEIDQVLYSLNKLADLYAFIGDTSSSIKCIKEISVIARYLPQGKDAEIFEAHNGYLYAYFGLADEAINTIKDLFVKMIDDKPTLNMELAVKTECYKALSLAYSKKNLNDSMMRYQDMIYVNQEILHNEFMQMKAVEDMLNTGVTMRMFNLKNKLIDEKEKYLLILSSQINYLLDSIKVNKDEVRNLISTKSKLLFDISNLDKEKKVYQKNNKKLESRVSVILLVATTIVLLLIIGWFVYRFYTARIYHKLLFTKILIDNDARSTYHNIKHYYNAFILFVVNSNIKKATEFAYKSSDYIGKSLNKLDWEDHMWSLENELDLLNSYKIMEESLGSEIVVIDEIDMSIIRNKTRFAADVFTILLQNSVKAAKKKRTPCIFKIKIAPQNGLLLCEVSDNGQASDREAYIREELKHKGLHLLKRKIEYIHDLESLSLKCIKPFEIIINGDVGTTIKFILPYVQTT